MFIMLSFCAGVDCEEVYQAFHRNHRFKAVERMGAELVYHINTVGPKRCDMYRTTWVMEDYGDCWWAHEMLGEFNNECCESCIYFYLSLEICKLL